MLRNFKLILVLCLLHLFAANAFAEQPAADSASLAELGYTATYGKDGDTLVVTNSRTIETADISAVLKWDDEENYYKRRPDSVTIRLLADGQPVGDEVVVSPGDDNAWSYTWKNMPVYSSGNVIVYSVSPVFDPPDYSSSVSDDGLNITYSFNAEMITVKPKILWDDDGDREQQRPPELTLRLLADGSVSEYKHMTNADENWTYEFSVPRYQNEVEIEYAFDVVESVPGYTYRYDPDDEWKVTYTHHPAQKDFSVFVQWDDSDNADIARPEQITVQLYANDQPFGDPVMLSESGGWEYTWEDVFVKWDGVEIEYTVRPLVNLEPDYISEFYDTAARTTITFSHEREITEIPFVVIWDDENDYDGKRPGDIELKLSFDGEEVEIVNIDATDSYYEGSFSGVYKYRDGEIARYKIEAVAAPSGYTVEFKSDNEATFIIFKHSPSKLVSKSIADYSNEQCKAWDILTITLSVKNSGQNILTNVAIRDHLPTGATFVADSQEMIDFNERAGDTITINGKRIDVNIGELAPGETREIVYQATAKNPASFAEIPAYYNYGSEEPLDSHSADPKYESDTVAPCYWDAGETLPDALPNTGFAPGRVTALSPMKVKYSVYSELRVNIPKLGVDAVILGVPFSDGNWDVSWLGENVGWLQTTAYPGSTAAGNTVLTGHLTNHFGEPGVFSNLAALTYGDLINITAYGVTYTYMVDETLTVYADTPGVLSQNTDEARLTLVTCKYYDEQSDSYLGRVVIRANLISVS